MDNTKLIRTFGKVKLAVIRHKSDIMFGFGMAGNLAGIVLTDKAARKTAPLIEEYKKSVKEIRKNYEKGSKEYKQEMKKAFEKLFKPLAKAYGPAVATEIAANALLIGSHVSNKKTIAGLGATTAALSTQLAKVKQAYEEKNGEGSFDQLYSPVKEKEVVNEEGKVEYEKEYKQEEVERIPFFRLFDAANSSAFEKSPFANKTFIENIERYANQRLQRNGYLFYNDVLKDLGMDITKIGYTAGWIYDDEHPLSSYVDFGLSKPQNARFMAGDEAVAELFFNCEPDIMSQLPLFKY